MNKFIRNFTEHHFFALNFFFFLNSLFHRSFLSLHPLFREQKYTSLKPPRVLSILYSSMAALLDQLFLILIF